MPKLHLVGITPDNRGLMLSEHARAKREDLVLEINDELLDAIERAERLRRQEEGGRVESAALPSKRYEATGGISGSGDRLTPRDIQHRLRAGETVAGLAKSSGLDEAWIERFAAPVLAELDRVVEQARTLVFSRQRAGASAVPLGQAVSANVLDKGVSLTLDEIDAGWRAYQRPEGGWCVYFSYSFKGRRHTAEWDVDLAASELTARNKLASELAYRESDRPVREPAPAAAAAPAPAPAKKPAKRRPPAKKAGGSPAPADKGPDKAAPPKAEATTPESEAGPGLVRQTLPGTSTEKPAGPAGGGAPEGRGGEPPASSAAVSTAHPPSPAPSPPAPGAEAPVPPQAAPQVVTGVQSRAPESEAAPASAESAPAEAAPAEADPAEAAPSEAAPSEAAPSERRRRTDPLGRRALFSTPGPPGSEETEEGEKVSRAKKAPPARKRPAAGKAAPGKKPAPAKKAEQAAPSSEPAPPPEQAAPSSEPAPPPEPPSEPSPPSAEQPPGENAGSGEDGPVGHPRSAPVPEPPAG